MISPSDMMLFVAVVRTGSFTRAAQSLGITKQTTSERIAKLEVQLGVRLLERTTRKLRVTGAGATYFERCAEIAAQIEEANREAQQREAEPVGLLRVSSPMLYGRRYLTGFVSEFLARHPRLKVELVLSDRRLDLMEEGIDVAIRIGALEDSSWIARPLGEAATYIVASPAFLAKHGTPTAKTLRTARCIGFTPFETWEVQGVKSRMDPVLIVNDLEAACEAALAGVGVAGVPDILCRDAVASGRLKLLFGAKPVLVRPIHALYPSRLNLSTKVRLFVDALAQHAQSKNGRQAP